MRNILVLPDGTEQSFAYPLDREIEVGTSLQVVMSNDVVHGIKVSAIERSIEKNTIYYFCNY